MERFKGIWQNKEGNRLIIEKKSEIEAIVTFISGKTDEPIKRPYFDNQLTIDMPAKLDFYETSVEVELWKKGKGFYLCLTDNKYRQKAEELGVGISRNADEEHKFLEDYYHLFEPLDSFKRIK